MRLVCSGAFCRPAPGLSSQDVLSTGAKGGAEAAVGPGPVIDDGEAKR